MAEGLPPEGKADGAFLTIGELAERLGLPQHVLRYWESRFPQLRPLQRAGRRRYYRPEDVALATRIDRLLNRDGYTVKGVQQLLAGGEPEPAASPTTPADPDDRTVTRLKTIRARLLEALAEV